jgi:hypothetical protein
MCAMSEREVPENGRRYESYSHEAMKAEVDAGNDPSAAGELSGQWSALGARMRDSARALGRIADESKEHWQGTAGDELRGMLGKAAGWSGQATEVSFAVSDAVTEQAAIAARAKAEMPDVVEYDPAAMIRDAATGGSLLALVGLSDQMSARRVEADAAKAKAVDVLNARDAALRAAVPAESFTPPPSLGTR